MATEWLLKWNSAIIPAEWTGGYSLSILKGFGLLMVLASGVAGEGALVLA